MRQCLRLAALLWALALPPGGLLAQETGHWRLVTFANEYTGAQEQRLILRDRDWKEPRRPTSDARLGATLIIACGERILSDSGRTLMFWPGETVQSYGPPHRMFAEFWFDDGPGEKLDPYPYDQRQLTLAGNEALRDQLEWVGIIADDERGWYSARFLRRLLTSRSLRIEYAGGSGYRTVVFDVRGLREALPQLAGCRWPLE